MGTASLCRWRKCPGRRIDHPSPPCAKLKKQWSYTSTPSLCLHCMLQTVLYFTFNIKVIFSVRLSPLTPFCSSQNELLTSLLVASISYHNCTDMSVTCYVTFLRYPHNYMLVTSVFRVHGYESNPTTPELQHTSNQEQYGHCGNWTEMSQSPNDGYINVRNMLST